MGLLGISWARQIEAVPECSGQAAIGPAFAFHSLHEEKRADTFCFAVQMMGSRALLPLEGEKPLYIYRSLSLSAWHREIERR